jgi:hypothetical protein
MSSSHQPTDTGSSTSGNIKDFAEKTEELQGIVLSMLKLTESANNILLEVISRGSAKPENEWEIPQSVRDELKRVAIEMFVELCSDKTLSKDEWRRRLRCRWE